MPRRLNILLEIVTGLAFMLTMWLLINDRTASAGVSVALSFGAFILRLLPDLESFEILGLKAKLREKLLEADEILSKLKRVASMTAKATVINTTYSNHIGGAGFELQSELLDEQIRGLEALEVGIETIKDVKRPALTMASCDLARSFIVPLQEVLRVYESAYGRLRGEQGSTSDNSETIIRHAEARQKQYSLSSLNDWSALVRANPEKLGAILTEALSRFRFSLDDVRKLEKWRIVVTSKNDILWKSEKLHLEVGEFLRTNSSATDVFASMFPDGPAGPDWDTAIH